MKKIAYLFTTLLLVAASLPSFAQVGTISQAAKSAAPYNQVYFGIYPQTLHSTILEAMEKIPTPDYPTGPFVVVKEDNLITNGGALPFGKQPREEAVIINVEPLPWQIVLDAPEGILLLTHENVDIQAYSNTPMGGGWDGTWSNASLRTWLISDFLNGHSENTIPQVYKANLTSYPAGVNLGMYNDLIGVIYPQTDLPSPPASNITTAWTAPAGSAQDRVDYFTSAEKGAITPSSLDNPTFGANPDNVNTTDLVYLPALSVVQQIFPTLSDRKSYNTRYTMSHPNTTSAPQYDDDWITRSHSTAPFAGYVSQITRATGAVDAEAAITKKPLRPSVRLDRDKVVMVSQSKPSAASPTFAANTWTAPSAPLKLTLVDASIPTLTATTTTAIVNGYYPCSTGTPLPVTVSGGQGGTGSFISAILEDANGVQYYTKAAAGTGSSQTINLNFSTVTPGTYTLKVFNEITNTTAKPDYSSNVVTFDVYLAGGTLVAPVIDATLLMTDGFEGKAYDDTVHLSTAGQPDAKFTVTSGSLPPGLSINQTTGRISGTISGALVGAELSHSYTFTVTASNPAGSDAETFTIDVYLIVPPQIQTTQALLIAADSAEGYLSMPYTFQFKLVPGTGLPSVTFTKTAGNLPAGLTLDPDGTLHGTPTTVETQNFTLCAETQGTYDYQSYTISIKVSGGVVVLPSFVTTTLGTSAQVQENTAFADTVIQIVGSQYINVMYDPTTFPTGLTFDPSTRKITGTPILGSAAAAPLPGGVYNLKLWAQNPATKPANPSGPDSVGITYTLTVLTADVPVITTASPLPSAPSGDYYTEKIESTGPLSGGTPALTITGMVPPGMTFTPAPDDSITGTSSTPGTYTFTVTATNSYGWSSKTFTLDVLAPLPPPIIDPLSLVNLPHGTVGQIYVGAAVVATNSPTSWSWTGAPAGLSLSLGASPSFDGIISGTPTVPGTYTVTFTATNPWGASTPVTATLVIDPSPLTIPPLLVKHYPEAVQYQEYSNEVSPGYTRPDVEWSIEPENGLPKGLHLAEDGTGVIVGTPQVGGIFHFTVVAKSKTGQFADVRQEVEFIVADESDVTIARFVRITGIPGATLIIGDRTLSSGQSAEYTINSGDNFVFIYAPTGTGMKGKPVITTNRTDIEDETIGLEIKQNTVDPRDPDAVSYLVTIYDIRSNISINAVPSSLQPVDDGSIRGGIGKAYITTPTDYTARIYNIAGQTVTTLKAKAGENVVTLPAGVYLVESHNGAVAKIIVQ